TLLWHHRLGHPSLPRLRGMASRVLVSGLPRSLPPLPPGPAPTCVPCVEGRQRAAPHSSEFPPTEAPLQTLHMDVWGPARIRGQSHELYFLLVVDDYSRYTTVFPLHRKDERFGSDFLVLRLHSDRGGEFSSDLLRAFCRAEGIRQTFTLLASPQQNGIAERRIGMYAAHQINLQPWVSPPETSPTLRWMGKVGDASAFRVWGSRAFVRDLSPDKLSSRAVPCVFLDFPPDAPGWQFYHPTSRRVLSSQDVTFDKSVPYYHAVEPVEVAGDSGTLGGAEPERVVPGGAGSGGAVPECVEPTGAGSGGAESGGAEPGVAASGGAIPAGAGPGGSSGALSRRELPSPQKLREWFARRWSRAAGAGGVAGAKGSSSTGGAGATGPGGARTGGTRAAEPGGATGAMATGGTGASGAAGVGATGGAVSGAATSAGGPAGAGAAGGTEAGGAAGAGAPVGAGVGAPGAAGGTPGAGGAAGVGADAGGAGLAPAGSGGAAQPRPYFVLLLEQVLGLPPSFGPAPSLECPPPVQSESQLQLASPLPAPSPYASPTGGLAERREPESRPASPVRTARTSRRAPRQRPPAVPGTHQMALRPSTAPQRVPLPSPPESSLPSLADPESDSLRADSPTVTRFLATAVTDPSFESAAASALVAKLVDFASHCRLDFATSLVAEFASICPPSVGGTYVDEVPPPGVNIVSGMWIFRVKRPPSSPPVFKARYVARGFSQRQGVDYFHTFSPTPKMTTLPVLLHVAAQRDYELHSLDFSTTFLQGSLHEEIWLRRPPGFNGSFPPGTQWSLRRPVYGLRQAPREWHDTLRTTLAALGFAPSTADPSLFLRTDTLLPPFYILVYITRDRARRTITLTQSHMVQQVLQRFDFTYSSPQATPLSTRHSLSALPSDESVEPSGLYPELVGCLMYLMTCSSTQWSYTFSLGSGSVSWRSTRSSSVLSSSCEAEIYAGAMAAQELRCLTYLLTDLGEPPRSPPVLYVDNKAMLALCREHRLEHRTKHIALRYFLARELQQRGQLHLAYMASQANTVDIFTKALQPCDHQCFCTMLGLPPHSPSRDGGELRPLRPSPSGASVSSLPGPFWSLFLYPPVRSIRSVPPVPASGQVAASSQVFAAASGSGPESAPCSCRLLSHQTLLWHHRFGHPSLPRLRGMASHVLVSGLPRSLPPLPPGPAPTCVPCVEGRQRAAPHSSEFPPTEAPLQTLHMDVWGPAR
ncbi:unnamed protein product, partial [Closterium sp. NIES-53]